ncbi:toxin-antitoxin system, antitoxin component, Xre domain protein [Bacteroides pyogenes F0041]|uniref:Toxin-antitoxin system, antitoxin component, Xre domain protein n=1 Tax=Bacteroides pyogenes F0041 TaxID=1321819 RepID=U2CKJ0_9BACE|nr:toxin-antitoxin system, antitoxin component, Xre domain protein [Bacteroides pyogenes F0041]
MNVSSGSLPAAKSLSAKEGNADKQFAYFLRIAPDTGTMTKGLSSFFCRKDRQAVEGP